jgi:hypothetical protein
MSMMATAALLNAVKARLAEDPEHVREALTLIIDPDALPKRVGLSEAARDVNARRVAYSREQFFAQAYRGEEVRARLGGISRQALNQRVRAGRLLAMTAANTSWFPDWQFSADGGVVPGLGGVLSELPDSVLAADRLVRAKLPEERGSSIADLLASGNVPLAVHYARTAGGDR